MEPEVIIAAIVALAALLIIGRKVQPIAQNPADATASVPLIVSGLEQENLNYGPSYFTAAAPYYYAPPVGNIMPQATNGRTIPGTPTPEIGCYGSGCRDA